MCDEDCEWYWVNIDVWPEYRGHMRMDYHFQENNEQFRDSSKEQLNRQLKSTLKEIVDFAPSMENGDMQKFSQLRGRLMSITRSLDEKYNNNEGIEDIINRGLAGEFDLGCNTFSSCKDVCYSERSICRKYSYEQRKADMRVILSDYEIKETPQTQIQFERRLVENFEEKSDLGVPICLI